MNELKQEDIKWIHNIHKLKKFCKIEKKNRQNNTQIQKNYKNYVKKRNVITNNQNKATHY